MKSRAAIARHPLHPMFVVIPIGAWFASVVGDIAYASTANVFWYQFAFYSMLIGLIGALVAAVFGFVDYFGVRMSEAGYRIARTHMILNLCIVVAYAVNLWLRWDNAATTGSRWSLAITLNILAFIALAVSGWLGGELAYRHKVGVDEHADPEATEIGMQEPVEAPAVPARDRGLLG